MLTVVLLTEASTKGGFKQPTAFYCIGLAVALKLNVAGACMNKRHLASNRKCKEQEMQLYFSKVVTDAWFIARGLPKIFEVV